MIAELAEVSSVRLALQKTMIQTVEDEQDYGNADYVFARPLSVPTHTRAYVPRIKWRADCSTGVRDVCWWTPGAPDPFENGWAPYGNSSTIWIKWHHAIGPAKIGDCYTFGYYGGEKHVAMVYDDKKPHDPPLWNFGQDGQPVISSLSREASYHRGMTITLCAIPIIDPPPTPEEKLRAMVGFYSWVSWRLGEGHWKHYGEANIRVRPNVPAVISAAWWVRYRQFLFNRKKGNGHARNA